MDHMLNLVPFVVSICHTLLMRFDGGTGLCCSVPGHIFLLLAVNGETTNVHGHVLWHASRLPESNSIDGPVPQLCKRCCQALTFWDEVSKDALGRPRAAAVP